MPTPDDLDRMPNMDDPFDLAAARKACRSYGLATDAEFIPDEKAFARSYAFAAHRSARHLHAALARVAELEAERDAMRLHIGKLEGLLAAVDSLVGLAVAWHEAHDTEWDEDHEEEREANARERAGTTRLMHSAVLTYLNGPPDTYQEGKGSD